MTFSPSSRQVVLQELFDEFSEPTDEEIRDYAVKIGIDVDNDVHLLSFARDCLMQPLPPQWKPCYDADNQDKIYYFNFKTGRAQWDHPLDEVHRNIVCKAKAESFSLTEPLEDDSRTTVREELKSFEEAPPSESQRSDMIPKPRVLAPLQTRGALRKPPNPLGPLKVAAPLNNTEIKKVSFDECEVKKRPNSSDIRNRRNIDPMEFRHLSKQEIMVPRGHWKDEGYATESSLTQTAAPLTLAGGGAAFLKKSVTKFDTQGSPKKVLLTEQLGRVPEKNVDTAVILEEDESNKVRFKFEKELKVTFEMPKNAQISENEKSGLSQMKQIEIDFEDFDLDLKGSKVTDDEDKPKGKMEKTTLNELAEQLKKDKPKNDVPQQWGRANSQEKPKMSVLSDIQKGWGRANSLDKPKVEGLSGSKEYGQEKSSRNCKKYINIILNGKASTESSQDNLIDLTEGESLSTIESRKSVSTERDVNEKNSMIPELDELINLRPQSVSNEKLSTTTKNLSLAIDDILKMGEMSSSIAEKAKPEEPSEPEVLVEKNRQSFETAKAEKLKALEGEFNSWVQNTEKMFREKEKQSYTNMREKYEDWRKNEENGMIKEIGDRCAEELQGKVKALRNELLKEEQEAVENLKVSLAAQTKERLRILKEQVETRQEHELNELRKSLADNLAKRKDELYKKHQEEMGRLERSLETILAEQRSQRQQELEKAREEEAALAAMRAQLKDAFLEQKTILQQEHEMVLQKLRQQHELELIQAANSRLTDLTPSPRSAAPPIEETNKRAPSGKDSSDPIVFEKLRCEKRLLEDKYKSLKEKYIRLKSDVKATLDKKAKKKEIVVLSASETDKSASGKPAKGDDILSPDVRRRAETTEKKVKIKKQFNNHLDNVNQNITVEADDSSNPKNVRGEPPPERGREKPKESEESSGEEADEEARAAAAAATRRRRQLFSRLKAASTSRLNSGHRCQEKDDVLSPVENLRRQLKKLEELEDEFPVTTHTDTYLRYPFTDAPAPQFASSELEFFKHRIHLERDSVRRAKEFLKAQKKCYENRQRELQHRLMDGGPSSKSILEQIHQEERELTEMEVSVHRTRALLGEKIIRLRHLEQSLKRVTPDRNRGHARCASREDATLSDLSSHSDSSGFSSTHHTSEPSGPRPTVDKNRRLLQSSMQESSEIIQSLENLNTEIRGIWEVLKQSSGPGTVQLPPPPLAWPAVRTNPAAGLPHLSSRPLTQKMMTQVSGVGHVTTVVDPTLAERTRSLRDWLKSARRSPNPADATSTTQVTL